MGIEGWSKCNFEFWALVFFYRKRGILIIKVIWVFKKWRLVHIFIHLNWILSCKTRFRQLKASRKGAKFIGNQAVWTHRFIIRVKERYIYFFFRNYFWFIGSLFNQDAFKMNFLAWAINPSVGKEEHFSLIVTFLFRIPFIISWLIDIVKYWLVLPIN